MPERHFVTPKELEQMRELMKDPEYLARLGQADMVEVDNPFRREVRPRRGTDEGDPR